jgi:hypothetical protein
MKTKLLACIAVLASLTGVQPARAAIIEFDYFGSDTSGRLATGSFTIDNSLFNGTNGQFIPNTHIQSLAFTANFFGKKNLIPLI